MKLKLNENELLLMDLIENVNRAKKVFLHVKKTEIFLLALATLSRQNANTNLIHSSQSNKRGHNMQLFSCRENEGIIIGGNIFVTVLDIRDGHVRLGLSSPDASPAYWEQTLNLEEANFAGELQLQ